MREKGTNQTTAQESNRTLLLQMMKRAGVCSRAELAAKSGLKQATITYIVNDFLKWGLVKETGLLSGEKGRRSIGIALDEKAFYVIGLRLTRQYFRVGLFDITGSILTHKMIPIDEGEHPDQVLDRMIAEAEAIRKANRRKKILAVGLAVPGPYYPQLGKIMAVTSFEEWESVCIPEKFGKAFDIPVVIEHDANAGALAEWSLLTGEQTQDELIYVAVGQGVGAGIIYDGQLFKGAFGTAGEIGHISMDAFGKKCACNNRGCLTEFVSTTRLSGMVREEMLKQKGVHLTGNGFSEIAELIKKRDEIAYPIFQKEIVRYLGTLLVNLIWCYSPNRIVLGDEMTEIGSPLVEELRQFVKDHTMEYLYDWTSISVTEMDLDPAFYGSGEVAINHILRHPAVIESILKK